ncbi:MAG: sugar ABC transporter ATP-binding protein [Isosphaeraceae bacterium]|nr:sugar ABC transporter ATP-binding protein [Isosphaeraceae bacterium]
MMNDETRLLRMEGISKRYGKTPALEGVTFELRRGEVHALVGENGVGKSTLMKVLSGATRPDSGTMELDGSPYAPGGPREALSRGVAMIYQEVMIAPHLTVEANVNLGQETGRFGIVRRGVHASRVRRVLELLDHGEIDPRERAGRLNPAGRQIVEIARALVSDARVLVFDEPTSSLNDRDSERLFSVISRLRSEGLGIVYISHFLNEVSRVADRYTVLRDGRSVATGTMEGVSTQRLASLMVGRALTELFPRVAHERGEVILKLEGVGGRRRPIAASLEAHRGEIVGIAGLVGAGRTELIRAIYGLDEVRRGSVRIRGLDSTRTNPSIRIAQGMGMLSEDRKGEGLALGRSIADNLTYPAMAKHARLGVLDLRSRRREVEGWIDRFRIKCRGGSEPVGRLSGGNQQKVAIARLFHQDADIFLLDEPTRGVDIASKVEIYRLIGEAAARGSCVLMVSSYLPELLGICDRIAVMSRGMLSQALPVESWSESRIMETATSGEPPATEGSDG